MMTSLKLKWMEKHKVLHCFILINLQQPTVKSPKYMFPHLLLYFDTILLVLSVYFTSVQKTCLVTVWFMKMPFQKLFLFLSMYRPAMTIA